MKKSVKVVISCIVGVIVLCSIAAGIGIIVDNNSTSNLSGSVVESSDEYGWRKTVTHINLNASVGGEKFYSNCDGDYITSLTYKRKTLRGAFWEDDPTVYRIEYNQYFNIADDLHVFFVLSDGVHTYTTNTETSHNPIGPEQIDIPLTDISDDYYIAEVWVCTED